MCILLDEAKQLFRAEPGLLTAAENKFKSKFSWFNHFQHCTVSAQPHLSNQLKR